MGGTESGKASTTYPLTHSYDTASTPYNNAPVPSGIGFYGSGGNEARAGNGSDGFWYAQVYGTNTYATFNGTETVDLNGKLVYYFKEVWQGSGAPTMPMPDHIDLRLTTKVEAFAFVEYGSSGKTSGLSSSATASDGDPFNESVTASASTPDASALYQGAGGPHLVRASVSGGIATVYLNGTVHMDANNTVPFGVLSYPMPSDPSYVWGEATNGSTQTASNSVVAGSVGPDSREASITCPTIEDSYYKGPYESQHGTDKYDHLRDPITGAIVTDSAVSPSVDESNGSATTWAANPMMMGQASGFHQPVFRWSVSGAGAVNGWSTPNNPLSVQFPISSTSTSLNQQSTVRLDVTDSDGATGANTFAVHWHYPYENWQPYGAQFQNSPVAYPSSNGPQGANGQVSIPIASDKSGINWNVAGKIAGGFLTVGGAVIGVAQPETDPIIIGFLAGSGYTLSVLDPPPTPQPFIKEATAQQFQDDVATEVSIYSGNTIGIFLPARPRMDPTLAREASASGNYGSYLSDTGGTLSFDVTAYREQLQQDYTGDGFDQHGYVGPAAGSINWEGPWQYVWDWFWTPIGPPSH